MHHVSARTVLVAALALGTVACASADEWREWKRHSSHFASGEHGLFSIRNRDGSPNRVTRQDVGLARAQSWWGKPVTVVLSEIVDI